MSQENVEKLHEAYELLNTRFAALKGGDIDDLLAFFDPEVVIEMVDAPRVGPVDHCPASYISARRGEWCRVELSTAAFHQFRGGRIVLDRVFLDRDEGLQTFAHSELLRKPFV
jgi:ketosteroid isomerase-like protein